jgi:hypothetical protein
MEYESGDLVLFEPFYMEASEYFYSLINGNKYGNVGMILKRHNILYCIQSKNKTEYGKFDIMINKLSDLVISYSGQIWIKKLIHPRGLDFENKLDRAILLLKYTNAYCNEYGPSCITFLYKYTDILPSETAWMVITMKSFENKDQNLLWLYTFSRIKKIIL